MPSTATTRNRLEKQEPGENSNTWGLRLNSNMIDLVDAALDGVEALSVSGPVTLTANDYSADQARKRVLNCTGTGGTITVPDVEKIYLVRNATSGNVTVQTAVPTASVMLPPGSCEVVFCDGSARVFSSSRRPAGALVKPNATLTTQNFTTITAVPFSAETYDTHSFHDAAINNSRLTVPSGLDGWARLSAQLHLFQLDTSQWAVIEVRKNGVSTAYDGMPRMQTVSDGTTQSTLNVTSPIFQVSVGDYFELYLQVETDASISISASQSWFAIEMVA